MSFFDYTKWAVLLSSCTQESNSTSENFMFWISLFLVIKDDSNKSNEYFLIVLSNCQ